MPTIRKIEVKKEGNHINEKRGSLIFTTAITYSKSAFRIAYPSEWGSLLDHFKELNLVSYLHGRGGGHCFSGDSESDVVEKFFKAAKEFYTLSEKKEKVILYKFAFASKNLFSTEDNSHRWQWESIKSEGDLKIEFDFRVCEKTTIGQSVTYTEYRQHGDKTIKKGAIDDVQPEIAGEDNTWLELPYSKQTEAFFTELYSGMEDLCGKFKKFMGSREKILKTLEQKQKLLN